MQKNNRKNDSLIQNLRLKIAEPSDAEKLLEIYSYYVENTAVSFEWKSPSVQEFSERISKILQKYPYYAAQIQENGREKIAGYAYAGAFKNRAAYEWLVETSIYVAKEYRRRGVGKFLLENLEKTLKEQNILNVNACVAYAETENSKLSNDSYNFHEKMGYSPVGTFRKCGYKFGAWFDVIWMEKFIGEHENNPKNVVPFPNLLKNKNLDCVF